MRGVLFFFLFAFAEINGILNTGGRETASGLVILFTFVLGAVLGGGSMYLQYTRERFERLGRSFPVRIVLVVGVFGLYTLMLTYHPTYAISYAITDTIAPILVVVGLAIRSKI